MEDSQSHLAWQVVAAVVAVVVVVAGATTWAVSLSGRVSALEDQDPDVDPQRIADFEGRVSALEDQPPDIDPQRIANLEGQVTTLESHAARRVSVAPVTEGFIEGVGAHAHTVTTARCPAGTYAAGIDVVYGGTCEHQCRVDGGIIQDIRLRCEPLPAFSEDG